MICGNEHHHTKGTTIETTTTNDTIPMVYFDTIPCIQNTGKSTAIVFTWEVAVGVAFLPEKKVPGADVKSQLSNGYNHCSLMFGCCDDKHGLCIG